QPTAAPGAPSMPEGGFPRGDVAVPNLRQPIPAPIVANIDYDALSKRLSPEYRKIYESLTPDARLALLQTIAVQMRRATNPEDSQLTVDMEKMKRQLEKLTAEQAKLADTLTKRALEDQAVVADLGKVDAAVAAKDYAGALQAINALVQQHPDNPMVTEKKKQIEALNAGSYPGYEQDLARNEGIFNKLKAQASQLQQAGDAEGARAIWSSVLALSPSKDEWTNEASRQWQILSGQVVPAGEIKSFMNRFRRQLPIIYGSVGGTAALILIVYLFLIIHARRIRARDHEILAQVKSLTQPIVDMQEEIRHLTEASQLALPELPGTPAVLPAKAATPKGRRTPAPKAPEPDELAEEELLPSAAPRKGAAMESPADALGDLFGGADMLADAGGGSTPLDFHLGETPTESSRDAAESDLLSALGSGLESSPDVGLDDLFNPAIEAAPPKEEPPAKPKAAPEKGKPAVASGEDLTTPLSLDFESLGGGPAPAEEAPAVASGEDVTTPVKLDPGKTPPAKPSAAPREPESVSPSSLDLDLDGLMAAGLGETDVKEPGTESTTRDKSAIIETIAFGASAETKRADDEGPLDLGLDFSTDADTKPSPPPPPERVGAPEPVEIFSQAERDLGLDLPGLDAPPPVAPPPLVSEVEPLIAEVEQNEKPAPAGVFADEGADETTAIRIIPTPVEVELPGEDEETAISGAPQTHTEVGVVFEQKFDAEEVGATPSSWRGDKGNGVQFEVSDAHPAPGSRRSLRYLKTSGTDSVYFARRFPRVQGVVGVEFDLCCPQKNKYLLGVYVERDDNYNQAVRTVVHCIDPAAASLRMQNEPAPYKMGEWRHVRYVIDLDEGKIDAYLDDVKVLDQQTFVNKPPFVNTISIRDNHATIGELLLDNIRVEKLA
ncbi:MAG: hypothetical protein NTW86_28820, partial [Candidatus Sumerlaeota bacterium]|nr:hypothetical protein [Candidatus Sumerlaeota bacterium]